MARRYGSKRYKRNWDPTPEQERLARRMGITNNNHRTSSGFSQEDRYRVDRFLELGSGLRNNSDHLNADNIDQYITEFDTFKQFAIDNNISFSGGNTGWLTRPEDIQAIADAVEAEGGYEHVIDPNRPVPEGRTPWDSPSGTRPYGNDWWGSRERMREEGYDLTDPDRDRDSFDRRFDLEQDHPFQQPRTDDVTLDLSDQFTFEGMTAAAPGRQGDYESGDDKTTIHPSLGTDVGAQAAYDLETRFIDDLYGTTDRVYDGLNREETIDRADETLASRIADGTVTDQWGLDLRRVDVPEGDPRGTQGTQQWYQHLTRGEVDWAHYRESTRYQAAWNALSHEDRELDNQRGITSVEEIRNLHERTEGLHEGILIEGQGRDAWRYDWDGKYERQDPPAPWTPTALEVYKPGTGGDSNVPLQYNTVQGGRVTPQEKFNESIYEVPPLDISSPSVNIRIPQILGGPDTNNPEPDPPIGIPEPPVGPYIDPQSGRATGLDTSNMNKNNEATS